MPGLPWATVMALMARCGLCESKLHSGSYRYYCTEVLQYNLCKLVQMMYLFGQATAGHRREDARAALGFHKSSSGSSSLSSLPFGLLAFLLSHLQLEA